MINDLRIKAAQDRWTRAKQRRSPWETMWDEVLNLCMPARQSMFDRSLGLEKTQEVFDETAVLSTAEFASRMQAAIAPPGRRFARFEATKYVPPVERKALQQKLDEINIYMDLKIADSNVDSEVHEGFMDLAIGTMNFSMEMGEWNRFIIRAAPLPTVWIEEGVDGRCSGIFRRRENVTVEQIPSVYRGAQIPKDLKPDQVVTLMEATRRDFSATSTETWLYDVWLEGDHVPAQTLIEADFEGFGSSPWITSRWSVTPDEWYGRGPLINLLPAIRSANLIREMIYENAEMAIGGMWEYPADGTINPAQIEIGPNVLIPRMPGSEGMRSLQSPSRFDIAQANLEDLRYMIRRGLFSEEYTPRGRTPLSAQEIVARQTDLAERAGSPFARQLKEFIAPLMYRGLYLGLDAGEIELPGNLKVNSKEIGVMPVSPLARAQKAEDIQRRLSFIGTLTEIMGPQVAGTFLKAQESVEDLADLYEHPAHLLHDNDSRVEEANRNRELAQSLGVENVQTLPTQEFKQRVEEGPITNE